MRQVIENCARRIQMCL